MSLKENIPDKFRDSLNREVAVLGAGASGKAVSELLSKLGVSFTIYDERSGETDRVAYEFTEREAKEHPLVIHSPAFARDHRWLEVARASGCQLVSEIDFAQQFRTGPTLVITGTNGKTTLQEFVTFCLKRAGISAVATGQNGYPLSRLAVHPELDNVTAVCELGPAFAGPLETFRFETLFWTNFHEDHLDDVAERRAVFQDVMKLFELSPQARFYLGGSVFESARELKVELPENVLGVRPEDIPEWDLPNHSAFATRIHRPALALFRRYWLDEAYADSLLKSAAEQFEVRAHRLHVSTIIGKTVYWNDSNASNFAATEAAIDNFDVPVVWIGGGRYRGGNLDKFVERIHGKLAAAVLIGEAGKRLLPVLKEHGINATHVNDLRSAVETAHTQAKGEIPVVFSPGFVAGEIYGDFMERGICFENAVLGLKHQKGIG